MDEASRKKLDTLIRELESGIPGKMTIYDYYVDVAKLQWTTWEEGKVTPHPAPQDPELYTLPPKP